MRTFVCAAVLGLISAGSLTAQEATVYGTVRTSEAALALSYAVVMIPALRREQFTNDRGAYTLREMPVGPVTLRFRHVGFAPRDTQIVVRAGDTLRVDMTLTRLVIKLDAMRITAGCGAAEDSAMAGPLAELFEQIRENALQYRLLVESHPFVKRMRVRTVSRRTDGTETLGAPRMQEFEATAEAFYRPGKLFRSQRGTQRLFLPELPEFADPVFIANHCFAFAGEVVADSVRYINIRVGAISRLKDPDIEGTITLRADGYGLAAMDLQTTGVPKSLANDSRSFRVVTRFSDIVPGVAVVSFVESFIEPGPAMAKESPNLASRGEIQMLEGVRWKKGPP